MTDEILALPEVAQLLKVAEKTVYSMAQKGLLPPSRLAASGGSSAPTSTHGSSSRSSKRRRGRSERPEREGSGCALRDWRRSRRSADQVQRDVAPAGHWDGVDFSGARAATTLCPMQLADPRDARVELFPRTQKLDVSDLSSETTPSRSTRPREDECAEDSGAEPEPTHAALREIWPILREFRGNTVSVAEKPLSHIDTAERCELGEPCKIVEEAIGGRHYRIATALVESSSDVTSGVVPSGHVFVLGDARDWSRDSRMDGAVPLENVVGTAKFIWWPLGRLGRRLPGT
jgi:hypothetical protein